MLLIGIVIGLIVGWIFLPMPAWVKEIYLKLRAKIVASNAAAEVTKDKE